jgi:hypothetical protein
MSSYEKDAKPAKRKRGRPKKVKDPAPTPEPEMNAPAPASAPASDKKVKKSSGKMTDAQRADLSKHMEKMRKGGMSPSEMKSHRMKLMSRMRKGMSASQAHKDVMK